MEPPKAQKRRGRYILTGIFSRSLSLSIVSIIASMGLFAFTIVKREQDMVMQHLEARAQLLAASVDRVTGDAIVAENNWAVVEQFQNMVQVSSEVLYTAVTKQLDGSSLVFTKSGWRLETLNDDFWKPGLEGGAKAKVIHSDLVHEKVLHYWYPLAYEGYDWGWIHVGISLKGYDETISGVYRIIVLLAIPGFVIGALLSLFFSRRLTHPISTLREFAGKVAEGNLDERIEVRWKHELGDLADSLNRMTGALGDSLKKDAQIREREVLLKEIHHRVKNNLQILTSLIRLQARKAGSDEVRQILKGSESRIRSMGLIHEKLYQSESLSAVDFGNYVSTLTSELLRMYRESTPHVTLDLQVVDVELGIDTALPCGLLVNELVSNSLKYAFGDGRKGIISVIMKRMSEGEGPYRLTVSDNGVGVPEGARLEREGSLGMRLIEMLVEQLNGQLKFRHDSGVTADIVFFETAYKQRV